MISKTYKWTGQLERDVQTAHQAQIELRYQLSQLEVQYRMLAEKHPTGDLTQLLSYTFLTAKKHITELERCLTG